MRRFLVTFLALLASIIFAYVFLPDSIPIKDKDARHSIPSTPFQKVFTIKFKPRLELAIAHGIPYYRIFTLVPPKTEKRFIFHRLETVLSIFVPIIIPAPPKDMENYQSFNPIRNEELRAKEMFWREIYIRPILQPVGKSWELPTDLPENTYSIFTH